MSQTIFVVNAFSKDPGGGNPAGVCLLSTPMQDTWMQAVARDMNLSETAFLYRERDGYRLRWFTPKTEVDLCGHATLAAAHILREQAIAGPGEEIRFLTNSGLLTARPNGNWIEMDFPAEREKPESPPPALLKALGIEAVYTGRNRFDYLLELDSEERLRKVQPDFRLLETVNTRGIIITARSDDPKYDFISRFFSPRYGIKEDPVTGSAHCCLGPFWEKRLGKKTLTGFQASKRGGLVRVRMGEKDRVVLIGEAVTVSETEKG